MLLSFTDIFRRELDVINFRRQAIRDGVVAGARKASPHALPEPPKESAKAIPPQHYVVARADVVLDGGDPHSEQRGTNRTTKDSNLTGIALSGGGVRSASFSLGVLQALDSLSNHGEPHVLDAVDYISTVSGGGYIGTSLVAGLMQSDYSFPFDSRLDEQETPETQHLRDFSNFLAPNGLEDYLVSAALVLRGLLVNAIIVLPVLLILAVITIVSNPFAADMATRGLGSFPFTLIFALLAAFLMFASAIFSSLAFRTGTLRSREILGRGLGALLLIVLLSALFEIQPLILADMTSPLKNAPTANGPPGLVEDIVSAFAKVLPSLAVVLTPAAVVLISAAQKLANLAKASLGEATWTAILKKHSSTFALYLAAVIVPLLLWIAYIYLCKWAIVHFTDNCNLFAIYGFPCNSSWSTPFMHLFGPVGTAYLMGAAVLILVCLFIGPNSNSLHRLYRDRLSRAFLFERAHIAGRTAPTDVDTWKFSSLKPYNAKTCSWMPEAAFSPYPLTNTAINLEGSVELNKRGRNADMFIFSPLHVGSRATGYVTTEEMEKAVPDLGLATAMAISGAAASANMGRSTIKILTFSLSVLNIRLGYWLANPARLDSFRNCFKRGIANIGSLFFAAETFGRLNEKWLNVYLTDGGHIENLGIYELLRRRCKVILAVDAEADPNMTFPALMNLEVIARIDLGIRIDLAWQGLQKGALAVTSSALYGPVGPPGSRGPHAAIGIIRYSDNETGVLIYIKSSLSGDEGDYILDYKRRNATFPHETTIDQFFNEEQFEAYRALGFHAARGLFTGADDFAKPGTLPPTWQVDVAEALGLLNVPSSMAAAVAAHP